MAIVDATALEKAVNAWEKSPAGQKTIAEELRLSGFYDDAAQIMINEIKKSGSASLPASVLDALNESISAGPMLALPDGAECLITFSNNGFTYRPSLEPGKYGGISNIAILFNEGYDADGAQFVAGLWHGHMTKALAHREGERFIESAVDAWNHTYGKLFDCTATIL